MSPSFITLQGHKYSHICNLWGKFLPMGMICTTTDTISIPVGEMYLRAKMFCTLACTSSIPMDAINFYMQERFEHSPIQLLYPSLRCIYLQECSVHLPVYLLFPWVQCQSLKPVLNQCSQTCFVIVDDFIALYTRSYVFYSHGCNKFLHARTFFCTRCWYDPTNFYRPIFTLLTEVWPRANRDMVTNNSTVLTEVSVWCIPRWGLLKPSNRCFIYLSSWAHHRFIKLEINKIT